MCDDFARMLWFVHCDRAPFLEIVVLRGPSIILCSISIGRCLFKHFLSRYFYCGVARTASYSAVVAT
jgi:hypothetical protein